MTSSRAPGPRSERRRVDVGVAVVEDDDMAELQVQITIASSDESPQGRRAEEAWTSESSPSTAPELPQSSPRSPTRHVLARHRPVGAVHVEISEADPGTDQSRRHRSRVDADVALECAVCSEDDGDDGLECAICFGVPKSV